jgi:hypothetical protein
MDCFEKARTEGTKLSIVNITTALNKVAKFRTKAKRETSARRGAANWAAVECAFLDVLLHRIEREVRENFGKFQAREISIVLWSLAKLDKGSSQVFHLLERQLILRGIADFAPQGLSNICWAYATAGFKAIDLFVAVEKEMCRRGLTNFTPQALSNLAWSFVMVSGARLNETITEETHNTNLERKPSFVVDLLLAIEAEIVRRGLDSIGGAALSMIAWSLAVSSVGAGNFVTALQQHIISRASLAPSDGWGGRQLSLALWSLFKFAESRPAGVSGVDDGGPAAVVAAVAAELGRRPVPLGDFEPQALTMLLAACVSPTYTAAPPRAPARSPRASAVAAAVFEMAGAEMARRGLDEWNSGDLARLAWVCAAGADAHGWPVEPVLRQLQAAAARLPAASWTAAEIGLLLWSAAAAGCASPALSDALEAEAERRALRGFGPTELGRLAWSHLAAGRRRVPLLRRVVAAAADWVQAGTCEPEAALQLGLAVLASTGPEERAGMAVARGLEESIRRVHVARGPPCSSALHRCRGAPTVTHAHARICT